MLVVAALAVKQVTGNWHVSGLVENTGILGRRHNHEMEARNARHEKHGQSPCHGGGQTAFPLKNHTL
jgi:hypothetical protein